MANSQAMCSSFKAELLVAVHDFRNGGDVFKIALYTSSATYAAATTQYSSTNEITGTGYTAGGNTLTNVTPSLSGTTAITDFQDTTWANATITANGAIIYNTTPSANGPGGAVTNPAVCTLAFGGDKTSTSGDFTIIFPTPDATSAIIRIA